MVFYVSQQKLDGIHGNGKGDQDPRQHIKQLDGRERQAVMKDLQKAGPKHDRNPKEKRKFRGSGPGTAKEHRPQDRRPRTGGSRDQRQKLEQADIKRVQIADLGYFFNGEIHIFVVLFQNDKKNSVNDQHGRDHIGIVKVTV